MMDAHRCDICGKMFVDVKYVQVDKSFVAGGGGGGSKVSRTIDE
jgi:hypothetical protein